VVGNAAPGEQLQRDPDIARQVSIRRLEKCHGDAALQKYLHEVLVRIGTRYVGKKKGWEKDKKVRAAVCNFRALMRAGGPRKFFKRVAALPTNKSTLESRGPTLLCNHVVLNRFHFFGKRGGLNGSTQHGAQSHLTLKTKAKFGR
jgi:hypothetical protein